MTTKARLHKACGTAMGDLRVVATDNDGRKCLATLPATVEHGLSTTPFPLLLRSATGYRRPSPTTRGWNEQQRDTIISPAGVAVHPGIGATTKHQRHGRATRGHGS